MKIYGVEMELINGLLNFSNEDVQEKEKDSVVEDDDEEEGYSFVSSQEHDLKTCSDGPSIKNEFGFVPESELIVSVNATSKPKLTLRRPKERLETSHRAAVCHGEKSSELEEEMMANIPKFKTAPD
ncbi:hypothetical protein IFM89_033104 [Coptis chinensis]|uniref:Uncharacterized protein n=1 Tax=Coptis chinensis TaxID=261450 RepID=A0A835M7X1_9MAGN|nr:hypothetical protein IFM89_033104 [Coptis chinensis]